MLKATRRYLRAVGSIMNIMPSTNYLDMTSQESDAQALRRDILAISRDMKRVIDIIEKDSNGRKQTGSVATKSSLFNTAVPIS